MTDDAIRVHKDAAISHVRDSMKVLEGVVTAAERGDYQDASAAVREARDRLYFAEIELRQAHVAAKRGGIR